jgi:hypothetical protein
VKATFTLGAASNGINPVTEPVTLQVGTFSTAIPPGSFTKQKNGQFTFDGTLNDVALEVRISPSGGKSFAFQAKGKGADLTGIANPVAVGLTIGDDSGTTTITAQIQ